MHQYLVFVKKLWPQRREAILAAVLLILMMAVMMMPAMQPLRTAEVDPKAVRTPLQSHELTYRIFMPTGPVEYFLIWIDGGKRGNTPQPADYTTLQLDIQSSDGEVVRTVSGAALITRDDRLAVRFDFTALAASQDQLYTFVVRQSGDRAITAQLPIAENIKATEVAPSAFQLGERESIVAVIFDKVYGEDLIGDDISFYFHRGQQIVAGQNPYSCVLDEEETCLGYPSHLPGMYLFAAGFVALGFDELTQWVAIWRPIMIGAWMGVGLLLFVYMFRRGQPALATAALGFWLFNRWSLYVLKVAHTDFMGVLFLVLAVLLAGRWPLVAALLLGISLAVKQVAILIVPLFLLAIWRYNKPRVSRLVLMIGLILLVPTLTALPFLWDDPQATVAGWLNVVERPAQSGIHGFAPALVEWLDITHNGKTLPMLVLVGAVYVAVWRKKLNLIGGTLMVFAITAGFTHVLFNQYFVWLIPFIPLALVGSKSQDQK